MTIKFFTAIYETKDQNFFSGALIKFEDGCIDIGFHSGVTDLGGELVKVIALSTIAKHLKKNCDVTYVSKIDSLTDYLKKINSFNESMLDELLSRMKRDGKRFFKNLFKPLLRSNCSIQFREPDSEQDLLVQDFCLQLAKGYASGKNDQEIKTMIDAFIANFSKVNFSDPSQRSLKHFSDYIEIEADVEQ